jgi:hypothetical protein
MRELAESVARGRKAIALAKKQGVDISEWEQRLKQLFDEAGREPGPNDGLEPWILWEWRRGSIPSWRYILTKCIHSGDLRRAEYARWMLREILLDPDYEEDPS